MKEVNWHALSLTEVFQELNADNGGLSEEEALKRLKQHGPNQLPQREPLSKPQIFLSQFWV